MNILYNKEELPIWKPKNNFMFNQEFHQIVLLMLCIQKYHFKYLDKNIFFLIIQKIASIEYLLPIKDITIENLVNMRFFKDISDFYTDILLKNKFIKSYGYDYQYNSGNKSGYEGTGNDYFEMKKVMNILKNKIDPWIIISKNNISFSFKEWEEKIVISLGLKFNLYTNVRKRKMFFRRIFRKKIEFL